MSRRKKLIHTFRVDEEVFKNLQEHAVRLEMQFSDPNDVLHKLLEDLRISSKPENG